MKPPIAPLAPPQSPEKNIRPPQWVPPAWDPGQVPDSLEALRDYAEQNAQAAIQWYYRKKPFKAWSSRVLRALSIAGVTVGGLMPVLVSTGLISGAGTPADRVAHMLRYSQLGYVCVALAAVLFWLDKLFGGSTAWMRYVSTAMSLTTAVEQFRMDWAKATAGLRGKVPEGEDLQRLINRITEFCLTVRGLVENETKAWIVEFQQNLMELEKRTEAALQTARSKMETLEQAAASQREASRPGAIDLTVENVLDTDAGYCVALNGKVVKEHVTSKTCGVVDVAPGLREVSVTGQIGGAAVHASQILTVGPGAVAKATLTLAKTKAAAAKP